MRKRIKWTALGIAIAAVLAFLGGRIALEHYQRESQSPDFFEDEIVAFEAADRIAPPAPGGIVFVGSSSIRFWTTLDEDMAPLPVIRRGFGGSQLAHVNHNAARIIHSYDPSVVVVYAGDNDLSAPTTKNADDVAADFTTLASELHARLPEARLLFIEIKPSPQRWDRWPEMKRANATIAGIAAADDRITVIDITTPMLGADGAPRADLFMFDGLHLSDAGYAVWTEAVRPAVERAYRNE